MKIKLAAITLAMLFFTNIATANEETTISPSTEEFVPPAAVTAPKVKRAVSKPALKKYASIENRSLNYKLVEKEVTASFNTIDTNTWDDYFKKQAKTIQKNWKKEAILKNVHYKTSFARILVYVNKNGEITSYDIKSSCIPKGDTQFIESVELVLDKTKSFDALPSRYNYKEIAFTIKFHTNTPATINKVNIDWERYGVADIEIGKNNYEVLIQK
jgi:hypothetical protein